MSVPTRARRSPLPHVMLSQGKAALVQHFQNSSLLHEDKRCQPVLFRTEGDRIGEPESFPSES